MFASPNVAQVREWLLAAVKAVVHPLDRWHTTPPSSLDSRLASYCHCISWGSSWQIAVLPPDTDNMTLPHAMHPQLHAPLTPDQVRNRSSL